MSKLLNPFQSLSLTDLLDAREAFHIHLINKENVIGTAIGKYRVRLQEGPGEKTLTNTKVDESSWPCILVFVDQWVPYEEFRKKDLDSFIPSTVFLPDGRRVPLCVIKAPSGDASGDLIAEEEILFPSDFIGGGYPLIIQSQGIERVASIGCVVSDGNKYYALTNRHVAGPAGTTVYTRVKGTLVPIGVSTDKFLGNKSFESLYKGFKGSNMVTNVDAALIEIKDYNFWKTDIFGLGTLGKLFDINTSNLTLDIIGSPVRAYGSISGELTAEISALFYRYKSVGGMEFVSDFLMGPRDGDHPLDTRHGDSGTLWVIDTPMAAGAPLPTGTPAPTAPGVKPEFRPIAIQWGQHCFVQGSEERKFNFALGTCLSNVLRELEVDIVGGWNSGSDYTWGEVGHYTIANFATDLVANPQLKKLIDANLELITFKKDTLQTDSAIKRQRKTLDFTPLADVPDLVWKLVGGPFKRPLENPNHFADMDKPDSNNKRLLDLCSGTGDNMKFLSPAEWLSYYSDPAVRDSSKGILPFRVWQIFLQMVDFARRGNTASFVAAAGVLAHYVGDACQPLHISFMFNGKPVPGQPGQKIGEDVHEAFESKLVNKHNKEIIVSVQALIKTAPFKKLLNITSGKQAGAATVTLMKETFATINPETIVDAFVADGPDFGDKFWAAKGSTILPQLFASGASMLASLWNSAWELGKGSTHITNLGAVDPQDIVTLYEDPTFLPSTNIKGIEEFLKGPATPAKKKAAKKAPAKKAPAKKAAPKKKKARV